LRLDLVVIVMVTIVNEDGDGDSEFLKSWWWRKVVGGVVVGSRVLMKRKKKKKRKLMQMMNLQGAVDVCWSLKVKMMEMMITILNIDRHTDISAEIPIF